SSDTGPRQWTPTVLRTLLRVISIPTFSRLAPKLACLDLGFELRGWPVTLVARRPVHVQPRVVGDVEAAEVAEPERPHRPVEAFFDRGVDVFERGHISVEQPVSLLGRRVQDPVDDETVDLFLEQHRCAAHLASQCHPALYGLI